MPMITSAVVRARLVTSTRLRARLGPGLTPFDCPLPSRVVPCLSIPERALMKFLGFDRLIVPTYSYLPHSFASEQPATRCSPPRRFLRARTPLVLVAQVLPFLTGCLPTQSPSQQTAGQAQVPSEKHKPPKDLHGPSSPPGGTVFNFTTPEPNELPADAQYNADPSFVAVWPEGPPPEDDAWRFVVPGE